MQNVVTWGIRFAILLSLLAGALAPGGQAQAAPPAAPAALAPATAAEPGAADNFYKFDVTADGLYRLSYADLQAAGLPVASLNPTTFQLFEQGVELAIYVSGEEDSSFDPGDFILFYGRAIKTQYSETNTYWLTYGAQAGLRMADRPVAPGGAPALTSFTAQLHLERDLAYVGDLPKEGLADRWYWEVYRETCRWVLDPVLGYIQVCTPASKSYTIDLPTLAAGDGWAELVPALRATSAEFLINPDHHAVWFANGQAIGESVWDGLVLLTADDDRPVAGAGPYNPFGDPDPAGNCLLTDVGGNYVFDGLTAGNYVVDLATDNFYGGALTGWTPSPKDVGQALPATQANDVENDSDGGPATKGAPVTLADGQVFLTLDFGFTIDPPAPAPGITQTTPYVSDGSAAVGDRVWYDVNGDGIQDPDEPGIENVLVCLYTDDGNGYYNGPIRFPQDVFIQGSNVISFTIPKDTGAAQDTGYVNWLDLYYPASFTATDDKLAFAVTDGGPWSIAIDDFSSGQVWLLDVTDPQSPVLLTGASLAAKALNSQLSFQDSPGGPASYQAAGENGLLSPANIRLDSPSDLLNPTNQADWVIVSHPAFLVRPITATVGAPDFPAPTEVTCPAYPDQQETTYFECLSPPEQLARHRQTYNAFSTMVIDATDVYDQFNGGVMHPEAFRQLAFTMRDTWTAPAPRFLVLVGDGHYDPLNHLGNSPPVYIPPYLTPVDLIIGEVAAMNRIVTDWNSLTDRPGVPFMGLGVLPVNSLAEAQTVVNKAILYDTTPIVDDWNMNVAFVADDKDIAGDFPHHLDDVADDPAIFPADYNANKIYLKVNYPTASATKTAILDAINNGSLFVNYAGHGSRNAWAGERLLDLPDVNSMTNIDRLGIFFPMTCLEGQYVVPNFPAFAETVVRHAGGGAVASWSATGRGVSTGHQEMLGAVYDAIFNYDMLYLGDITTFSKQALFDSGNIFQDLLDTYVILGDPATAVRIPQADLEVTMTAESPAWQEGQPVTLTIHYANMGQVSAHNVTLDALLPSEFSNWTWSGQPGVNLTGGTSWSIPDLAAGASGVLIISGVLGPMSGPDPVEFQATASTTSLESHLGNNTASAQGETEQLPVALGDQTWIDTNGNGIPEAGELLLNNVILSITGPNGPLPPVVTGGALFVPAGNYLVEGLQPGTYTVTLQSWPAGYIPTGITEIVQTLAPGETNLTFDFPFITTTGVDILAFTSERQDGAAVVRWMTANEQGLLGFRIYRSQDPAEYGLLVSQELIDATGDGVYRFVDAGVGEEAYYYWIEAISQTGSQFIGPSYLPAAVILSFRTFLPAVTH